jgi:hypothetical protein
MKTDKPEATQQARRGDQICATGATGGGIDSYQRREEDLQVTTWGTARAERLDLRMNMRRKRQMMETGPVSAQQRTTLGPLQRRSSAGDDSDDHRRHTHGKPKDATCSYPSLR